MASSRPKTAAMAGAGLGRSQEPGARGQGPGARSQEARARGQGPGARKPGARRLGPGARSQELLWGLPCGVRDLRIWAIHRGPSQAMSREPMGGEAAGMRTSGHVGCWRRRWRLSPLHHHPGPHGSSSDSSLRDGALGPFRNSSARKHSHTDY